MNEISSKILNNEKERIMSQMDCLKRKQKLIEKFMTQYSDATIDEAQGFLAWIEHSSLSYSKIIFKLGLK